MKRKAGEILLALALAIGLAVFWAGCDGESDDSNPPECPSGFCRSGGLCCPASTPCSCRGSCYQEKEACAQGCCDCEYECD